MPKQRQQDLAHLAGTEPEYEAGQDDSVDLGRAPCIALQHLGRAEVAGAGYAELDVAELAQQMARIGAVTAVAHGAAVETVEPVIDRFRHPALDDLAKRLAAQRAVALAPLQAIGRLSIVAVRCGIGVLLLVAVG